MTAVDLSESERANLRSAVSALRVNRRFSEQTTFRYSSVSDYNRAAFFEAVAPIEFRAWVHVVDKEKDWASSFPTRTVGDRRLLEMLLRMLPHFPHDRLHQTRLLLEFPRTENDRVARWRKEASDWCRQNNISPFRQVKSQTDSGTDGEIIQLADMVAGCINRQELRGASEVAAIANRIQIVG